MTRPLIYVAAPFSAPDPIVNTRNAIDAAQVVWDCGGCPLVPHSHTFLWHMLHPAPTEDWYERDLHLLERCDALIRLPGFSPGADREAEHAALLGLPVYRPRYGNAEGMRLQVGSATLRILEGWSGPDAVAEVTADLIRGLVGTPAGGLGPTP